MAQNNFQDNKDKEKELDEWLEKTKSTGPTNTDKVGMDADTMSFIVSNTNSKATNVVNDRF